MSLNKSYLKSLALMAVAAFISAGFVSFQAAPASAVETSIPSSDLAEPQMVSPTLAMFSPVDLFAPTYGSTTSTEDGFTVPIDNFNLLYDYSGTVRYGYMGSMKFGKVEIDEKGLVTVTDVPPGTKSFATITAQLITKDAVQSIAEDSILNQVLNHDSDVSETSLIGDSLVPILQDLTPTSDGFEFTIVNYDPRKDKYGATYTWTPTVTTSTGEVELNHVTGVVTVVGLAPGISSTVKITAYKEYYEVGVNTIVGSSQKAAPAIILGPATQTTTGFSFSIENPEVSKLWAATATNGGSVAIGSTGLVTVTGLAPNAWSIVTVTANNPGFAMGRATIRSTPSLPTVTASLGAVTPTPDGFSFAIDNYDASFNWTGTATNGGSVSISNAGLVKVTGLALNTSSTVTITASKAGFASRTATITATASQPGGTASFGTVTRTSDGFSFAIANYDASFNWAGAVTNGGSVAINNTGLVTVTGLPLNVSSTVTITSYKTGFTPKTAAITSTALQNVEGTLTVGTFKGYVAIYQKGYKGHTMTAKVAGKWIKVDSIASNFERTVRYTGTGYKIFVHLYIDGTWLDTIQTITK
jgi:titin